MSNAFKKPQVESRYMKQLLCTTRTAHFIDIENLSESSILSEELVREVKREYFEMVQPGPCDIFVIGVSHFNLAAASFGWGSGVAQYVVQSGEDGADLALCKAACDSNLKDRFLRVCIASGDYLLAAVGETLKRKGVIVKYAARQECVARSIFVGGSECVLLPSLNSAKEHVLVS